MIYLFDSTQAPTPDQLHLLFRAVDVKSKFGKRDPW